MSEWVCVCVCNWLERKIQMDNKLLEMFFLVRLHAQLHFVSMLLNAAANQIHHCSPLIPEFPTPILIFIDWNSQNINLFIEHASEQCYTLFLLLSTFCWFNSSSFSFYSFTFYILKINRINFECIICCCCCFFLVYGFQANFSLSFFSGANFGGEQRKRV